MPRYAYFPAARRLAIRRGGSVTLYDTADHAISGVQQQQGGRGSLEFSSQLGSFHRGELQVVDGAESRLSRPAPVEAGAAQSSGATSAQSNRRRRHLRSGAAPAARRHAAASRHAAGGAGTASEIGAAIETLAALRDKGLLTDDEFTAKKTELLARL